LQILEKHLEKENLSHPSLVNPIQKAFSAIDRITNIIKGARFLSRHASYEGMKTQSLIKIIQDTLNILEERFSNSQVKVHLETTLDAHVLGDDVHLSQIFLNLIFNALD